MGIRQYLESTVVSLLSQGMAALVSPRESPVRDVRQLTRRNIVR